ncbi:MAG: zinc-binding alcohol dehydrogenase family protein [Ktedonobacteraceae bacterium]
MRAIQVREYGDYDRLQVVELPLPEPSEGQVVVKMTATAVNPLDNIMRLGRFPVPLPFIPGNEGAGIIEASAVPEFVAGMHVMFKQAYRLPRGGTWQEYVLAPAHSLILIPDGKSDLEAAALRTAYETAQISLTVLGGFEPGQVVLSPGVGGGVGNAVVQLALSQGAARVITTARSSEKAEKARVAGFTDVIDLQRESLREGVARLTNNAGVDLVIDGLGGEITRDAMASLKPGRTHVLIGDAASPNASFNISRDFLQKGTRVVGYRNMGIANDVREQAFATFFSLWKDGRIRPLVGKTFPFEDAAVAQRYLMEGRSFGKVLLTFN